VAAEESPPGFEELLEYLKQSRGFDFTGYKRPSLQRRVNHQMYRVGVDEYDRYIEYLELHPDEFTALFNSILINVTGFFRDTATWMYLRDDVLPKLVEQSPPEQPFRVWVAGCASGEEAYTVAMILADLIGEQEFTRRVKIYGTDVDEEALALARAAVYDERQMSGVPEEFRARFFDPVGDAFSFRSDLRRSIIFGRLDVLSDAPISRLSLLTCRNTLMYFNADTQAQVIERFSFALNDGGVLLLGQAETLFKDRNLFEPIDRKHREFRRVVSQRNRERTAEAFTPRTPSQRLGNGTDLHRAGLMALEAPVLLLGPDGNLVAANDNARVRLGVNHRDIGLLLQDLEVSYRPVDLRTPIGEALLDRRIKRLVDVSWNTEGAASCYDITISPLYDANDLLGVSVVFDDRTRMRDLEERLEQTTLEVEQAYQELQSTNEELETTNEELQSTIEELETTNEELQSTNEELETMNEELQSTNDELHVVNEELRLRGDEVDLLNHFLESVLSSFGGGVAVIDRDRRVRMWNSVAEELWGLREQEVRDVDLLEIDTGLPVGLLAAPLEAIFSGQDGEVSLVVDAFTRRGRAVQCRVAITPLRAENAVEGALIVMDADTG